MLRGTTVAEKLRKGLSRSGTAGTAGMGDDMRQKEHLTVRLDQDLGANPENCWAMRIPISDTISLAFDALEKKEKVSERSGKSGKKVTGTRKGTYLKR